MSTTYPEPVTIISDLSAIYQTYDQTAERREVTQAREQLYHQFQQEHAGTLQYLDLRETLDAERPETGETAAQWWARRDERYEATRLETLALKAERKNAFRSIGALLSELAGEVFGGAPAYRTA